MDGDFGDDDVITFASPEELDEDDDVEEMDAQKGDNAEEDKKMLGLVESAPRITVHTLDTPGSCTHEVAVPPGQEYVPLKPPTGEPAKTYKFTLDPFQVCLKDRISNFANQIRCIYTGTTEWVNLRFILHARCVRH